MVKRKKLCEYIFLQLFEMASKIPVAPNTDMASIIISIIQPSLFYW